MSWIGIMIIMNSGPCVLDSLVLGIDEIVSVIR